MAERTEYFDHVLSESLTVDKDGGIIRGVKILGQHSRHGRTYADSALNQAVGLYEGITVNIDHPNVKGNRGPDAERGFLESIGTIKNVSRKGDGVYGDLHYFKTHPYAPLLLERATIAPNTFGLSHNAKAGRESRQAGRQIIESFEFVRSVDIVGKPATNKGLYESEGAPAVKIKKTIGKIFESVTSGPYAAVKSAIAGKPIASREIEVLESATDDEQAASAFLAVLPLLESEPGKSAESTADKGKTLTEGGNSGDAPAWARDLLESVKSANEKADRLERKQLAREALAAAGVDYTTIAANHPDRLKLLESQPDEAAMKTLVESWPAMIRSPRGGRNLNESIGGSRGGSGSNGDKYEYPKDHKAFASAVKSRR